MISHITDIAGRPAAAPFGRSTCPSSSTDANANVNVNVNAPHNSPEETSFSNYRMNIVLSAQIKKLPQGSLKLIRVD
nr:hypothetical protein [Raoultella terrigena]